MKKLTFLFVLTLCFSGSVDAQIFKKLGKKIGKVAEKTVERKVEQKTRKKQKKHLILPLIKKVKTKKTLVFLVFQK